VKQVSYARNVRTFPSGNVIAAHRSKPVATVATNIVGMDDATARAALITDNLYLSHLYGTIGTISTQSPAAGTAVMETSGVVGVLAQTTVPNVVGMTITNAIKALDSVGLFDIHTDHSASVVTSQNPAATTVVSTFSAVTLTV
jgi:beta-lactam-binding protein with PASTA domain